MNKTLAPAPWLFDASKRRDELVTKGDLRTPEESIELEELQQRIAAELQRVRTPTKGDFP